MLVKYELCLLRPQTCHVYVFLLTYQFPRSLGTSSLLSSNPHTP